MGERVLGERIQFIASLPPIQSAVSLDGMGDGARIKIDIPRTELPKLVDFMNLAGKAFKVTVEELPE